jgi:hypothetical protein
MTQNKGTEPLDIDKAVNHPASVFSSPQEVLDHPDLSTVQKLEILQRWQFDAVEETVAMEEGMPGDADDLVIRIADALKTLTDGQEGRRSAPTKHGTAPTK